MQDDNTSMGFRLRTLLIVLALGPMVLVGCGRKQSAKKPPALVIESGYIDEDGKIQRKRQVIPMTKDNLEKVVAPILTED